MNVRRLAALVLTPIVTLPLIVANAAFAHTTKAEGTTALQAPEASPSPLTIAVSSLSPVSIGPGDVITLSGTINNTTDQNVQQLSLLTGVGSRVTSRGALSDDFANSPGIARTLNPAMTTPLPTTVTAHTRIPFSMTIDVHAAGLDGADATVYPLILRARGALGRTSVATLGEVATYLPYFPGTVAAPLRIVWIWPLDAPPSIETEDPAADSVLATSLAAGGRLRTMLDLGASTTGSGGSHAPVTWAIEPSLLEAADRIDTPASRQWLADLGRVTRGQNVIPLPYGDVDAVALVRAGLSSDLATAIALGRADIGNRLPEASIQNVAWPIDGAIDQATLDTYAAAGLTQVLLSGDQVPPTDAAGSATESAPVYLESRGPTVRGLAIDPFAQQLLSGAGKDTPTPQLARQQLLALLAVAVAERPNQTPSRDVVLALPRDVNPDQSWISDLLQDTASLPWLTPVSLATTATDRPGIRAKLQPYPAAARSAEIPARQLTGGADSVATLRTALTNLRSMLPDDKLTRPIDATLTKAESVFWRTDRDAASGQLLAAHAQTSLGVLRGGVRLAVTQHVTLTSRNGKIPVTVENSLTEDVTVRIGLEATDPTRLGTAPAATYVVPAGHKQRVLLPAKAERSGTFKVTLVALTPDGTQLTSVPLTVHSKAYGTITLAITFTALGVLVVALAFRARRRIRRWRGRHTDNAGNTTDDSPLRTTPGGGP